MKIKDADFFGYSIGGTVALSVAMRHPDLVRKLAVYGSSIGTPEATYEPESYKQYKSLSADFAPPVLKEPYDRMSPDPSRWPVLITEIKNLDLHFKGYSAAEVKSIKAQALVIAGDRDVVRPEHSVEMYRLIPNAQLAIIPAGDHFMLWSSPDKIIGPCALSTDPNEN